MVERILKQTWDGMDNDGDGWPMTAPVGSYPAGASPFGALDMAGNVAEWTAGSFENYTSAAVTNPQPPAPKEDRVFRGGSWIVGSASEVRAASRSWTYAYRAYFDIGFRCVLGD
jgi:serine/threonine-protein kinase